MRRREALGIAIAAALLAPLSPARAATVLDKSIAVSLRPDGTVAEHTRITVRLDSARDIAEWSPYSIYLDENRRLLDLTAFATQPDGRVVKVGRKGQDTLEVADSSEIHSSRKLRTVEIPNVPPGSVFTLEYQVEERPYFPSGVLPLRETDDPVEHLRIEVGGAGGALPGWRWRLDGSREGLDVKEGPGRVVVTASGLSEVKTPDHAPDRLGPVLRYSWGPDSTWPAVGRWYQGLLAATPRGAEAVRKKAQEIAAGIPGKREKIEALAAFARKDVRYVAVEVGIGGYRPAPPADVLTHRWGDCKDKSLLLVDLLEAAGVQAYPALIRLAPQGRVDAEFPSPDEFNHEVVAVPAAGLEVRPDDTVSGGYLFLDATATLGSAFWLPASDQDQEALVIRGDQSVLVHTAVRPAAEFRFLEVIVAATAEGNGVGQVRLDLTGEMGAAWIERMSTHRPEENEAGARSLLGGALPGANLSSLGLRVSLEGVPLLRISARVEIPGLLPEGGPSLSFQPPTLHGFPSPGILEGRKVPVVLTPEITRSVWRIQLPEGACPPVADDAAVDNELGSFRQKVSAEGGTLTVERRAEVRSRWIEPARFPALKELALAEHRAGKRLIRLECGAERK